MEQLDQLTTVNLLPDSIKVDGKDMSGIWLTLGYSRYPGQTHHQLPRLLLSQHQAHSFAMALLTAAETLAGGSGPAAGSTGLN